MGGSGPRPSSLRCLSNMAISSISTGTSIMAPGPIKTRLTLSNAAAMGRWRATHVTSFPSTFSTYVCPACTCFTVSDRRVGPNEIERVRLKRILDWMRKVDMAVVVSAENVPAPRYADAVNTVAAMMGLSAVTRESQVAVQPTRQAEASVPSHSSLNSILLLPHLAGASVEQ